MDGRCSLDGLFVTFHQLFDLVLDRQAVAVPARHIGRIESGLGFGADDDVLEDLVDRVPDVDVTVGVRRAVVQDELGTAGRNLSQLLVALLRLPLGQPARFAPGQIAAHGERGIEQIDGFFQVHREDIQNQCASRRRVAATSAWI